MSRYRNYNGRDKYHFRFYRKNGRHPFIVVLVETRFEDNKTTLSGYMITHDIKKMLDYPNSYVQLSHNPNPKDESPAYLCLVRIDNIPQKYFSKPFFKLAFIERRRSTNWYSRKEKMIRIGPLFAFNKHLLFS